MAIITINLSPNPTSLKSLYNSEVVTFGHITDPYYYNTMVEIEGIQDKAAKEAKLKELYEKMDEDQPNILLYHEYIFNITSLRISGPSIVGYDKVWTWEVK